MPHNHDYRNRLGIPRYERDDDRKMRSVDWLLFAALVVGGVWILASAFMEIWSR